MAVSYSPEKILVDEIINRVQNGDEISEVEAFALSEMKKFFSIAVQMR